MRITAIECPADVKAACTYYVNAIEQRKTESKARLLSIVISFIGLAISALAEANDTGWFVTITMFVGPSFIMSLFHNRDAAIKSICYWVLNSYTCFCLVLCILGIAGVLSATGEHICLAKSGLYPGGVIMSTNVFYLLVAAILIIDMTSWVVCGTFDKITESHNKKHAVVSSIERSV